MSEYFGGTSESDDGDSESSSSPERRSHEPISAKPIGEVLFGGGQAEKAPEKHQTLWDRHEEDPDRSGLFAAIAEKAATEKVAEIDDDDEDDDEENEEKRQTNNTDDAESYDEGSEVEDGADIEKLSDDEKKLVVEEFSEERGGQLAAERETVEENSPEDAAVAATELYHDKLTEKLEDPESIAETAIEEASQETIAEMEAMTNPAEIPEVPGPEPDANKEEDPVAPAAGVPAGGPGGSGNPSVPGGGSVPPGGATPPFGARAGGGLPPFGGGNIFGGGFGATSPNTAPATPNTLTPDDLHYVERRGQLQGLVAGGIVGYLLGRRRGRIRTEERLLPVQEKLKKEVKGLHDAVTDKETTIRQLATEKASAVDRAKREAFIEQLRKQPEATASNQPENRPNNVSVNAERAPEQPAQRPEVLPAQQIERVDQMSHEELLETSAKVMIDGTSLRTIYEARQITEPGLRHILAEYLTGGNVKKALNEELFVKQLSYERDPRVRDQLSAGYGATSTKEATPRQAIVSDQLSSTEGHKFIQDSLAQTPGARSYGEQSDIHNEAQRTARRTEQVIVGTWLAIVIALATVAAILFMKKH